MKSPLTQKQLSEKFFWVSFPNVIQDRLYQHYQRFAYEGNVNRAKADVESCSILLSALANDSFYELMEKHRRSYGQASSDDLKAMVQALTQIQEHEETEQLTEL